MTLVGLGLAMAFTAVSASNRLDEKMTVHQAALDMARAKLDEALSQPDFQLAADPGEDRAAGQHFGYRVRLTPVDVLSPAQQQALPSLRRKLERIDIEVFWGPKDALQSYSLVAYRPMTEPPAGAATSARP